MKIELVAVKSTALLCGMVGMTSSLKLSAMMLELDKADKNSQRPETNDAMRTLRRVSARRKIRS